MVVQMTKTKKTRRKFTKEFKAEAVELIRESGKSIPEIARDIDVNENSLYHWRKQAAIDRGEGLPGLMTSDEKAELVKLRRELQEVRMERDFLKKTAAYFASVKK